MPLHKSKKTQAALCAGKTCKGYACKNKAKAGCVLCAVHVAKNARDATRGLREARYTRARANASPYVQAKDERVIAPENARTVGAKKPATPADVDGTYEIMHTKHEAAGIRDTAADTTTHPGSWRGMLRDLAVRETRHAADFDFKALSDLHSRLTTCCVEGCCKEAKVGAHVWIWRNSLASGPNHDFSRAYIVPTCSFHNARKFDRGGRPLVIRPGTPCMSMLPRADYGDFVQ